MPYLSIMTVWGIDLGVRSFYAAGIHPNGRLELFSTVIKTKGKISDQSCVERGQELHSLSVALDQVVRASSDQLYIEEPPMAGQRNIRIFLKLAQVSGVLGALGISTTYVPVDTWKMEVCGAGGRSGMDKERVSQRLRAISQSYYEKCAGDQNFTDATCIALYGLAQQDKQRSPLRAAN